MYHIVLQSEGGLKCEFKVLKNENFVLVIKSHVLVIVLTLKTIDLSFKSLF